MSSSDGISECCAACSKGGDGLKKCTGCKMVVYCNRECQLSHRPRHKAECKRRAAELLDEALFKEPTAPREECPLCFLPLPLDSDFITYQPCCGKNVCVGCLFADSGAREKLPPCPFCRTRTLELDDLATLDLIQRRVDANDPEAFSQLASAHRRGNCGLEPNLNRAKELYLRGAALGSIECHSKLGDVYFLECKFDRAIHHLQVAALGGNITARYNLGVMEDNSRKAMKHLIISASAGHDESMDGLKNGFRRGNVTKEELEAALRAHKHSRDETKSDQRDKAIAIIKNGRSHMARCGVKGGSI